MSTIEAVGNVILALACLGTAFACFALDRRLRTLNSTRDGVGQAIAAMTAATANLQKTLTAAGPRLRSTADEARRPAMPTPRRADAGRPDLPRAVDRPAAVAGAGAPFDDPDDPLADVVPAGFTRRPTVG